MLGCIIYFVFSMGMIGIIIGVLCFLCEQEKLVIIVGLQLEEGSSILGICCWLVEYMLGIFNVSLVDQVLDIYQNDVENIMCELVVCEGIFCGVSFGGVVVGVLCVVCVMFGVIVVVIICDCGDCYLFIGVFGEEYFSQGVGI